MKAGISFKLRAYLFITLACACYALSFVWCFAPNGIAFGGLTGICQIINHFIPAIPVGVATIVLNIPLFLLGWKRSAGTCWCPPCTPWPWAPCSLTCSPP